jgi:hypothetical protein
MVIEEKELVFRVKTYLERARTEKGITKYPLREIGCWDIMSGIIHINSFKIKTVRGRYIDAVEEAVKEEDFYSTSHNGNGEIDVRCRHNGKILKANVKDLEESDLIYRLIT